MVSVVSMVSTVSMVWEKSVQNFLSCAGSARRAACRRKQKAQTAPNWTFLDSSLQKWIWLAALKDLIWPDRLMSDKDFLMDPTSDIQFSRNLQVYWWRGIVHFCCPCRQSLDWYKVITCSASSHVRFDCCSVASNAKDIKLLVDSDCKTSFLCWNLKDIIQAG